MSPSTPSIRISQYQRYQSPPTYPSFSTSASPMAIPRAQEPVPPPLPPPTYIPEISAGQDPGWQWGNDPNASDFGRPASIKPGSSLLGGSFRSPRQEKEHAHTVHHDYDGARRGSSISTITAVGKDHDMADDSLAHSDEDGSASRRASNYRCVSLPSSSKTKAVNQHCCYS